MEMVQITPQNYPAWSHQLSPDGSYLTIRNASPDIIGVELTMVSDRPPWLVEVQPGDSRQLLVDGDLLEVRLSHAMRFVEEIWERQPDGSHRAIWSTHNALPRHPRT